MSTRTGGTFTVRPEALAETFLQDCEPEIQREALGKTAQQSLAVLEQQEQGGPFQTHLFAGGDTVAGPRYVVIETTHDEVVTPYANAFLSGPNVTNITLQSQCPTDPVEHIGMASDSPVWQNILNQLSATPSASFKATCSNFGLAL
jgi:hypothetical protein